jgi:metal-responsive CopG/Arc/MetJ family transcriptional regulator
VAEISLRNVKVFNESNKVRTVARKSRLTLDEDLLESLDIVVKELNTTRSAFTREALREAVKRYNIRRMEEKHRRGYAMYPVKKGEFDLR